MTYWNPLIVKLGVKGVEFYPYYRGLRALIIFLIYVMTSINLV